MIEEILEFAANKNWKPVAELIQNVSTDNIKYEIHNALEGDLPTIKKSNFIRFLITDRISDPRNSLIKDNLILDINSPSTSQPPVPESESEDIIESSHISKIQAIEQFCSLEWDSCVSTRLAAMFVEVSMPKNLRTLLIDKLIDQMNRMQLNELPPLVYQIFLHSRYTDRRRTVSGIVDFFNKLENEFLDVEKIHSEYQENPQKKLVLQVEGTVLLHIHFCVQQDREWGLEILKFVKRGETKRLGSKSSSAENLTPFLLAILLNIGSISSFRDTVFDSIKSLLMVSSRDYSFNLSSNWGSELLPKPKLNVKLAMESISIRESYGWENIILQLTSYVFLLLDYCSGNSSKKLYGKPVSEMASETCKNTLEYIFKSHKFVRPEIVRQMFLKIEENPSSFPYLVSIVCSVLQSNPEMALDLSKSFSNSIEWIINSDEGCREYLISAISPIIVSDPGFTNSIILILRKGLYSSPDGNQNGDQIPSSSNLLNLTSLSTIGAPFESIRNQIPKDSHVILLELVGLLRRSFSQQPEVISHTLLKLNEIVILKAFQNNTEFSSLVCRILHSELLKFYKGPGSFLEIKNSLNSSSSIVYPFPLLLFSFFKAVFSAGESLENSSSFKEGLEMFLDILDKILDTQNHEFGINVSEDSTQETQEMTPLSEGRLQFEPTTRERNGVLSAILVGCYDVLIDLAMDLNSQIQNSSKSKKDILSSILEKLSFDKVLKLFSKRNEIISTIVNYFAKTKPPKSSTSSSGNRRNTSKNLNSDTSSIVSTQISLFFSGSTNPFSSSMFIMLLTEFSPNHSSSQSPALIWLLEST
ncbi:Fanconi anemia group I protein-like protein [Smittium mucronatum]|uniref:Fanconi anemia group I protein-like protein n=1 Tax=Smittium mucronatum TaxID=133383 RepID=A0A1R0H7G6_9FUNG|nr:Fanconi anemia group I protein-like protein [Smittium mucronatum]